MAKLLVTDGTVTVSLSLVEKAEAVHGDVSVPRAAVVSARMVPDGMDEVHGLRMPGTGRRAAVVLELTGQHYDRIVVTVDNPDEVVASLT